MRTYNKISNHNSNNLHNCVSVLKNYLLEEESTVRWQLLLNTLYVIFIIPEDLKLRKVCRVRVMAFFVLYIC